VFGIYENNFIYRRFGNNKKDPQTPGLVGGQTQNACARQSAGGGPTEAFIIYEESSSPSADDYIIDADYPIETYL
jgi:hypothetical protein